MIIKSFRPILLLAIITAFVFSKPTFAQKNYKNIPLPSSINGVNEEFSGMAMSGKRLFLLPQYGQHKESQLDSLFCIYSINADSIGRIIDGKDSALTQYKTITVKNLEQLPDSVKKYYQGFEAITIVNKQVFLAMETDDHYDYCFLLKGTLDDQRNEIRIDPVQFIALKRFPYITNAGFESLAYLPNKKKLLAIFEFNGMPDGGKGFLIDMDFNHKPQEIKVPFLPFRITDVQATKQGKIYGINYYWNGDYQTYLNNIVLRNPEEALKSRVTDLKEKLNSDHDYLKRKTTTYARLVALKNRKSKEWKQVVNFDGTNKNWEGLALYRNGALVITDANRNGKLLTTLAFLEF